MEYQSNFRTSSVNGCQPSLHSQVDLFSQRVHNRFPGTKESNRSHIKNYDINKQLVFTVKKFACTIGENGSHDLEAFMDTNTTGH